LWRCKILHLYESQAMIKIDKHISELLYDHECVIVPDMGGFLTKYSPAEIHSYRNTISPPSKKVSFNVFLTHNDGLLANQVARYANVTYAEALQLVNNYVDLYRSELEQGKKFIIEGVGALYKDSERNVQFEPFTDSNFLKDSFGFSLVQFYPIDQKPNAEDLRPSVRLNDPKIKINLKNKSRLNKVLLVASLIWLTLNIYFVVPSGFNFASLNIFSKDTLMPFMPKQETAPVVSKIEKSSPSSVMENAVPAITENTNVDTVKPIEIDHQTETPTISNEEAKYFLVAGAFKLSSNAIKLQNELKAEGFQEAEILDNSKNNFKLVYLKSFSSFEEASADLKSFSDKKEVWIYTR